MKMYNIDLRLFCIVYTFSISWKRKRCPAEHQYCTKHGNRWAIMTHVHNCNLTMSENIFVP